MGVDYEERVDFARLRGYRMARARAALEASECGAFLLFDFYNIRYTTQTWIGGALGDKMIRYALVFRDRDTILWDFGSAVRHHKLYSTWLPDENYRPGFLGFRGAVAPEAGLMRDAVPRSSRCSPRPESRTLRWASTSSSPRSCSSWSGRESRCATPSSPCWTPGSSSPRTRSCC